MSNAESVSLLLLMTVGWSTPLVHPEYCWTYKCKQWKKLERFSCNLSAVHCLLWLLFIWRAVHTWHSSIYSSHWSKGWNVVLIYILGWKSCLFVVQHIQYTFPCSILVQVTYQRMIALQLGPAHLTSMVHSGSASMWVMVNLNDIGLLV